MEEEEEKRHGLQVRMVKRGNDSKTRERCRAKRNTDMRKCGSMSESMNDYYV
jgi:hypothetical protein